MPAGNVTKDRGKVRTIVDKTKSKDHVAFGYMQSVPVEFIKTDLGYYWAFLDSPAGPDGNKAGRFLSKDLAAAKTYVSVKGGIWVDDADLSGFEGAIVNVKHYVDHLLAEEDFACPACKGTGKKFYPDPNQGSWEPASAGTEQPITTYGRRLLYVYQATSGKHAYLDLDSDIILSDDEANRILHPDMYR